MSKAWNEKERFFGQSYEDKDIVDSAVVIMPLVFFSAPVRWRFLTRFALSQRRLQTDNRFISTLDRVLASRDRGGLTANGLVYRYDTGKAEGACYKFTLIWTHILI